MSRFAVVIDMAFQCAENMPGDIQDAIDEARSELNDADVDYEATVSTKLEIAQCLFGRQGKADLEVVLQFLSLEQCMHHSNSADERTTLSEGNSKAFSFLVACQVLPNEEAI